MIKKLILIVLFLLIGNALFSQGFVWAGQFSSDYNHSSVGNGVAADGAGNVYSCGSFMATTDFDPGKDSLLLQSAGNQDAYISKLDASGKAKWAMRFGTGGDDNAYAVTTDKWGNIYVCGRVALYGDFDPGPDTIMFNTNGSDIFICKINPNGHILWAHSYGGSSNDAGLALKTDDRGYVYMTGFFRGTADFDPGPGNASIMAKDLEDVFVTKLDTAGKFIWAKAFSGTGYERGYSITVDKIGNVYTCGHFEANVDFNPGSSIYYLYSVGLYDMFISKLNPAGKFVWAKKIGGTNYDEALAIACDDTANLFFTGFYFGTNVDLDPGTGTAYFSATGNTQELFCEKLDSNGNYVWALSTGGPASEEGDAICLDNKGNIYITGYFGNKADFNPGKDTFFLRSANDRNAYILKLNKSGKFVWAVDFGEGNRMAYGTSVFVDDAGDIYNTGCFETIMDADPGVNTHYLTTITRADAYILKLECRTRSLFAKNICDSFIWRNKLYKKSGYYSDTIANISGCDSVLSLDLRILNDSKSVTKKTACMYYKWHKKTFEESGVYFDTIKNYLGCDSLLTLDLTIDTVNHFVYEYGSILKSKSFGGMYQWLDCADSMKKINGETSQTFVAKKNGYYAVQVQLKTCIDTSPCILINNIATDQKGRIKTSGVYPIPCNQYFNVNAELNTDVRDFVLYNSNGLIIGTFRLENNKSELPAQLKSGFYFIKVRQSNGTELLFKLIVAH